MKINYNNPEEKKKPVVALEFNIKKINNTTASSEAIISMERLQEAIIWAELLGKPVCKRRKRR
jgi:hypothetical protein